MATEQTLISILRFAALVAPAIAIVMQMLENKGEVGSFPFRFLEIALISILAGTSILLIQLISMMEDTLVVIGSLLIFVSVASATLAIGWGATSLSQRFAEATGVSPTIWTTSKQLLSITLVFFFPVSFYSTFLYFFDWVAADFVNVGPIRKSAQITPTILIGIAFFMVLIRTGIYLVRCGAIPVTDLSMSLEESFSMSAAMVVAVPLIGLMPIYGLRILLHFIEDFVEVGLASPVYVIPYLWTGLVVLILYASTFDGEE